MAPRFEFAPKGPLNLSKILNSGAFALAALCLPASAAAQSYDPAQTETQVAAAFTLPLGHSTERSRTAPRLELVTRTRLPDSGLEIAYRDSDRRWQERRMGLTLDGRQSLMLNGREMRAPDRQHGVSTGVLTAGGVVLALGIGTLIVYDMIDDASE